ncbi:MAG TPA: methionine synthase [Dehalococcoidia bacterium]
MTRGLLTTTVGSFPKPPYLQQARNRYLSGRLSRQELHELELRATREVIRLQEELGLDILVDGEMARGDMTTYFAEHLEGMEISGLVRSYGNRYYRKPIIKGPVRWQEPITLEIWRYAQSLTDRPVKGMLTGPYTMVDWSFLEHYGSRREAVLALAEAVHREARALDEAGARYIQIDEPAVSSRPGELDLAIEAMGVVTRGLRARTITHICYGDFDAIFPHMLEMPVDQFDLELANRDFRLLDLFRARGGFPREIGLGVIDVHSHQVEPVERVKAGIEKALEFIPPERIYVDPDCGLKTRTPEEARAKLAVMVEAVRQVKRERGIE